MLHVCASATLYRPLEVNYIESPKTELNNITNGSSHKNGRYLTNSTGIGNNDESKRYIEQIFLKDGKNQSNDFYILNSFGKLTLSDLHTLKPDSV